MKQVLSMCGMHYLFVTQVCQPFTVELEAINRLDAASEVIVTVSIAELEPFFVGGSSEKVRAVQFLFGKSVSFLAVVVVANHGVSFRKSARSRGILLFASRWKCFA